MTLYAVKELDHTDERRGEIRSWWVHLTIALVATAVAILVLVLNGIAEHEMMPRMVQNAFSVAAAAAWTLFYVKRAEARILGMLRQDRREREDRIAALGVMVSDCRREQSALGKVVREHQGEAFAEGWLARSGENPEIEAPGEGSTVILRAVR